MEEIGCLSNRGIQFAPASVVFHTPPATAPKYQVSGSPTTPSIASARPPRNGPICLQRIPLNSFSSIAPDGAGVGDGAVRREAGKRKTETANAIRTRLTERQFGLVIRLK